MAQRANGDLPVAEIRPFRASDLKEVRMLLGMSVMEQLASANKQAYFRPVVIGTWIALSAMFVQYMNWYPRTDVGILGYLAPLPAFASCAVPIMFGLDWLHRTYFEKQLKTLLTQEDTVDIPSFYTRSRGSGFFVLSYKNTPIGCVAIDAATPDSEITVVDLEPKSEPDKKAVKDSPKKAKRKQPQLDAAHAVIRHFHVDSPYRQTGVENDLIAHAISHAFSSPKVQTVYAPTSSLIPSANAVWRSAGFQRSGRKTKSAETLARHVLSGVQLGWMEITRTGWQQKQK
ncbi:hypothetical protein BOTBODRAFT_53545 [Botryobasidium botryosum FD-172 SS1]|uniref:Uncharacterized protein n=1 Tax=Botryobasidium botryosum (strain FD-172 SS1) TaxID=930990 RepID=A0A067MMY1_BOTB1|nr:hypothetical protein BOTBODRAFT_53545 [Botryobasidium botryosum FD-172 SS1]